MVVLRAFLCLWQNIWWAIRRKSISMCSSARAGAFACYHLKMFWMMASSKNREGTIEVIVCSGRLSITLINLLVTAWVGPENKNHQLVRWSKSWCLMVIISVKLNSTYLFYMVLFCMVWSWLDEVNEISGSCVSSFDLYNPDKIIGEKHKKAKKNFCFEALSL